MEWFEIYFHHEIFLLPHCTVTRVATGVLGAAVSVRLPLLCLPLLSVYSSHLTAEQLHCAGPNTPGAATEVYRTGDCDNCLHWITG